MKEIALTAMNFMHLALLAFLLAVCISPFAGHAGTLCVWLLFFYANKGQLTNKRRLSLRAQGFQALLSGILSSGDTAPDTQMLASIDRFYTDPVLRHLHASDDSLAGPINYCNLD